MKTMKFNPGFLLDEELAASFCIRTEEFESIMEMLRECNSTSNPHRLIIGPRGSGKTTLLLRTAIELRNDPELSRTFLPILFAEESYSISSAGEFWLEALARLAEQAPNMEDRNELVSAHDELRHSRDEKTLGKRCLAAILDFADRFDLRLVLIVENLNMIFSQLPDPDMGWELRQVLQTEPRILLLASASSRFEEIDNPDRAFFDLLAIHALRPLDTEQCSALWQSITGQKREPGTMGGIRVLTGGSPRFVSILARFGADLSFRNLMADLYGLIDDLTEYFRNHLEALPPQERRVYVALLELWEPATARQIADLARVDTNKCSALLNRLVARGIVQEVGGEARRKVYYSSERLYNIFFLLRNARSPNPLIAALIKFIDSFYTPSDLKTIGLRMVSELTESRTEAEELEWLAFSRLIGLPNLAPFREQMYSQIAEFVPDHIERQLHIYEAESSKQEADVRYDSTQISNFEQFYGDLMIIKAQLCAKLDQLEEVIAACDDFLFYVKNRNTEIFQVQIAQSLVLKGLALLALKREQPAVEVLSEAVCRFKQSTKTEIRSVVLNAQLALADVERKKGKTEWSIEEFTSLLVQIGDESPGLQCQAHLLRACAYVDGGNLVQAEQDIVEALSLLPDAGFIPEFVTEMLMDYAIIRGMDYVSELIKQSPSADLLLPLTVALDKEMGEKPLVALEVDEVAEDIRKDIRQRRQAGSAGK